jgi:hypothetical protein
VTPDKETQGFIADVIAAADECSLHAEHPLYLKFLGLFVSESRQSTAA